MASANLNFYNMEQEILDLEFLVIAEVQKNHAYIMLSERSLKCPIPAVSL